MDEHRRKIVLVVEDDPAIGELIAGAIADEVGYEAIHVEEPGAALATMRHVTPDAIIVDVCLPVMSGFELHDRVRRDPRTWEVPVLFETARVDDNIEEFRGRGIATFVRKPFELSDVVAYVKRLAGAPSRLSESPLS